MDASPPWCAYGCCDGRASQSTTSTFGVEGCGFASMTHERRHNKIDYYSLQHTTMDGNFSPA